MNHRRKARHTQDKFPTTRDRAIRFTKEKVLAVFKVCKSTRERAAHKLLTYNSYTPGTMDQFGLYAAHYAAMNEDENAPAILEAVLGVNRFAAQQVLSVSHQNHDDSKRG